MSQLKRRLKPYIRALHFLGVNVRQLYSLRLLPRYLRDRRAFKLLGGKITNTFPIMSDYLDQAGTAKGQYFHQDLLVASLIHEANPARHIDVGSRIDGFVAHVASFRKIEVMDVRELENTGHENISFLKADLMDPNMAQDGVTDSLSCLHAIEHFGLGRYGDPLDPDGHVKGFRNLVRMVRPGGMLFMGFPIGIANAVHFNAHRVFHPHDIFSWYGEDEKLELVRFDFVDDRGDLYKNQDVRSAAAHVTYGCGIYSFRKLV